MTDADSPVLDSEAPDRSVTTRWGGHAVLTQHGFVPVVRAFLWHAAKLPPGGLSPVEAMFVLQLMNYKWEAAAPYPSIQRIAANMGISEVYVRKLSAGLEKRGFLKKTRSRERNNLDQFPKTEYDLQPLFDRLARYELAHPAGR